MAAIDRVQIEYERLKTLFLSVEQSKSELVDNLIYEAAFMRVQLESLQNQIRKYGAVQISKRGGERQTEEAKYYTKLVNAYGTVIKTLNSIMGKNIIDEDGEFDKFIGRMSE